MFIKLPCTLILTVFNCRYIICSTQQSPDILRHLYRTPNILVPNQVFFWKRRSYRVI